MLSRFLPDMVNAYKNLLGHAKLSPEIVYKLITAGVQHKLTFFSRTTNTNNLLDETEKIFHEQLLPSIVNHANYDDLYRKIFSLPVRKGGLNIISPEERAQEHNRSKSLAAFLYDDGEPDAEGRQAKLNDGTKKEKALIQ